ncbi:hypothetical protein Loa_00828 [Legionella oakridgensis ATCC 33761 = DSM 21215]|uniref:Uncharacterized protein n=1 Tax=Legionella oakridgensis ATCC 33761 = DSM 21215 TaxID=1268635 RepID=W0BCI2_9GAMM|nr:hypothetical protein Loa_00828 [Legionella oakridgensis ATCC 33761 = DSM 21215]
MLWLQIGLIGTILLLNSLELAVRLIQMQSDTLKHKVALNHPNFRFVK